MLSFVERAFFLNRAQFVAPHSSLVSTWLAIAWLRAEVLPPHAFGWYSKIFSMGS